MSLIRDPSRLDNHNRQVNHDHCSIANRSVRLKYCIWISWGDCHPASCEMVISMGGHGGHGLRDSTIRSPWSVEQIRQLVYYYRRGSFSSATPGFQGKDWDVKDVQS